MLPDSEGVDPRPTWAKFGLWFDQVLDEEDQQPEGDSNGKN